jgi:hypothetical protein
MKFAPKSQVFAVMRYHVFPTSKYLALIHPILARVVIIDSHDKKYNDWDPMPKRMDAADHRIRCKASD